MNQLELLGRKRTLILSLSVLLLSIYTIYSYHSVRPEIDNKKLIQQLIRLSLTILLLTFIYIGKYWAKIVGLVLFTLGCIFSIFGLFFTETIIVSIKIPLIAALFIYAISIYHFGFSKSFKAFFDYQNKS